MTLPATYRSRLGSDIWMPTLFGKAAARKTISGHRGIDQLDGQRMQREVLTRDCGCRRMGVMAMIDHHHRKLSV
jgi:hypothetical protein